MKRSNRRRRRLTPGFESLEGRQLLSTVATTLDPNSNPIIFTIGSGGVVSVNRQVATNNLATPYQSNGLETLPGLDATSIAAYQLPDGSSVVLATTGPESYIYANEYSATSNPTFADSWSGWNQISQFVAQSVIAVSATNGVGPAIFAVGADDNVYENLYSNQSSPGPYTDFQILPGLTATSLAAIYDTGSSFSVFALTGPGSYVYQDTTTFTDGTITTSGWTTLTNLFVASSISLANGPSSAFSDASSPNNLMVFATGAGDGQFYSDSLTLNTNTGDRTGAGFGIISPKPYNPNGDNNPSPDLPLVASSAVDSGDYLTVFSLSANGNVNENQYLLTGLTDTPAYWVGWQLLKVSVSEYETIPPLQASAIASTVSPIGGVEVVTNNAMFTPEISSAPPHAGLAFPGYTPIANNLSYATTIASTAYHPIVTTKGVTGYPVVFTIGSDGTVYDSQDEATGTGVTTTQDTYSALTALPGILATSLAATTEPDGIALFALTKNMSQIFENQYRPTGTSGAYAWTGWSSLGDFFARSIAAATGGDSAENGPTVFAIGEDGNAYYAGSTAPVTSSAGYSFGNFTQLTGLGTQTISVASISTGILVAATAGPESYAYANLDTAGTWSGWQQTTNTLASSTVLASSSATGGPAIGVSNPQGNQAFSTYNSATGWSGYQTLFNQSSDISYLVQYDNPNALVGFVANALPDDTGLTYVDLVVALQPTLSQYSGIISDTLLANENSIEGSLGSMIGNSLAIAPDGLQPTIYLGGTDGQIYVNQAVPSGNPNDPYTYYLAYVSLGAVPS